MTDLKPCPFCGRRPTFILVSSGTDSVGFTKDYKLCCPGCGCQLHSRTNIRIKLYYSPHDGATADESELKKAIEDWNRRADND